MVGPDTLFTLGGSLFGTDTSAVTFDISGEKCTVTDAADDEIKCTLADGLPPGYHKISVNIEGPEGLGDADTTALNDASMSDNHLFSVFGVSNVEPWGEPWGSPAGGKGAVINYHCGGATNKWQGID